MSTPPAQGPRAWRAAGPELVIAVIALGATAAAAYAVAQAAAVAAVVVPFAVIALVVVSRLLPARPPVPAAPGTGPTGRGATAGRSFPFRRLQDRLRNGVASRTAYDANLGPYLQHLLAARLSEHLDVNLYSDPEAARRALCPGGKDLDLWPWVDPGRGTASDPHARGIPVRALSRLVRRIEQL